MWAAQSTGSSNRTADHLRRSRPPWLRTAGVVGVQLAHPSRWSSTSPAEASVLMTMQGNVDPAVQYDLPIKIFIIIQSVHGNGAPVAGAAARRPLLPFLYRGLPDSQARGAYHAVGHRCERPGDVDGAIREMIGDNKAGIFRLRFGRSQRKLLPMIPLRARSQRDAARRRHGEAWRTPSPRKQRDGVMRNC